jgi:hypothetical protein
MSETPEGIRVLRINQKYFQFGTDSVSLIKVEIIQ